MLRASLTQLYLESPKGCRVALGKSDSAWDNAWNNAGVSVCWGAGTCCSLLVGGTCMVRGVRSSLRPGVRNCKSPPWSAFLLRTSTETSIRLIDRLEKNSAVDTGSWHLFPANEFRIDLPHSSEPNSHGTGFGHETLPRTTTISIHGTRQSHRLIRLHLQPVTTKSGTRTHLRGLVPRRAPIGTASGRSLQKGQALTSTGRARAQQYVCGIEAATTGSSEASICKLMGGCRAVKLQTTLNLG